ncbi:MAG: thiamine-monophosphate kinase [Nocardioidaceae bacterium]|nr:thiamine-monophosphate kinase [Nocardioidaceae bacterium]
MLGMTTGPPDRSLPGPSSGVLPPAGTTLSDAGEFGALGLIIPGFEQGPDVVVGPGDDAAELRTTDRVLICTDVLVDGRHFRRDWATAQDIGHRAAAQSLSDINAMGGRATAVTVGLAAPADLEVRWLLDLAGGIAAECALVSASVVGGDLTGSDVLVISVSALGVADRTVLRSGARPGDVVALCGRQGWAAAGLGVLSRGFRSPRAVVDAYRRPEVPYGAGAEAAGLGATSMIDVSDGLVADLGHVARSSGVHIDVDGTALVVAEPLQAVGAALGVDPLSFVLGGGDDHPLAATFPAGVDLPDRWTVIGGVSEGEGVGVDGADDAGGSGWQHF